MDLTQGTPQEKQKRAKKMMLWFGIISLIMSFAGLTSAFIVSSSREDWLVGFCAAKRIYLQYFNYFLEQCFFIRCKANLKKESGNHNDIPVNWGFSSWDRVYLFSNSRFQSNH